MAPAPENAPGNTPGNDRGNALEYNAPGTVWSYNLDSTKTPGRMKVRWKVRVETGQRAEHWNRKQADAIREFLEWAHSYTPHPD